MTFFICSDVLWVILGIYSVKCGPGSSVGIATELQAGWSGDRIPVGRDFSLSRLGLYNGYWVFPRGKVQLGCAADHSPPSSATVMEE